VLLCPTLSIRVGNPCHLLDQAADAASIGSSHQSPSPDAALGMPVQARTKSNHLHPLCSDNPSRAFSGKPPLVALTGHVQCCQMRGAPSLPSSSTRAEQWAADSHPDWLPFQKPVSRATLADMLICSCFIHVPVGRVLCLLPLYCLSTSLATPRLPPSSCPLSRVTARRFTKPCNPRQRVLPT
jgi:hypothetical protein